MRAHAAHTRAMRTLTTPYLKFNLCVCARPGTRAATQRAAPIASQCCAAPHNSKWIAHAAMHTDTGGSASLPRLRPAAPDDGQSVCACVWLVCMCVIKSHPQGDGAEWACTQSLCAMCLLPGPIVPGRSSGGEWALSDIIYVAIREWS